MIDDDVKITINLNKLVEARAKLQSQYGDYSRKYVRVSILMVMILIELHLD